MNRDRKKFNQAIKLASQKDNSKELDKIVSEVNRKGEEYKRNYIKAITPTYEQMHTPMTI